MPRIFATTGEAGAYNLIYDKTQNIINCPEMLE